MKRQIIISVLLITVFSFSPNLYSQNTEIKNNDTFEWLNSVDQWKSIDGHDVSMDVKADVVIYNKEKFSKSLIDISMARKRLDDIILEAIKSAVVSHKKGELIAGNKEDAKNFTMNKEIQSWIISLYEKPLSRFGMKVSDIQISIK